MILFTLCLVFKVHRSDIILYKTCYYLSSHLITTQAHPQHHDAVEFTFCFSYNPYLPCEMTIRLWRCRFLTNRNRVFVAANFIGVKTDRSLKERAFQKFQHDAHQVTKKKKKKQYLDYKTFTKLQNNIIYDMIYYMRTTAVGKRAKMCV